MADDRQGEEDQILRWVDGTPPAFEVVSEQRQLPFDASAWQRAMPRLQTGAAGCYGELARTGPFGRWWPSAIGGQRPGIRRFRLQLPEEAWERPWEGMIGSLDPPRWKQVSIIRQTASDTAPLHPAELESAFTVLIAQGEPTLGKDRLDLEAELRAIESAYAMLDFAVREAVAPPIAIKAGLADLPSALLQHRPTVLWFSGHARADPPGLLLADGNWLTPEELADFLRKARADGGRMPLYVVLWACRTGSAPQFGEPMPAPAFVEALAGEGVAALLVSQAPLSDEVARRMAGEIFAALASGLPLDHGVTRARADLMRLADDKGILLEDLDWICPVVWSHGHPPPALRWTDRRHEGVRRQGLARKLIPARLVASLDLEPVERPPWPDQPRVWVTSPAPDAEASRAEWARRVIASQRRSARSVLWLDFSTPRRQPATAVSWLRDWAKRVTEIVEHDDDPTGMLRTAARQIVDIDHESGWRTLCSNDWFVLAIMEPPDHDADANWLWDGLRDGNAQAIVLARDYSEQRAAEVWTVDSLMDNRDTLERSKWLAGLALLGSPAPRRDIEDATGHAIDDWLQHGIVVETSAGCVMPAGAAQNIALGLTPEECVEGHDVAYDFLNGVATRRRLEERGRDELREAILVARWHHAQLAGFLDGIRLDGENLLRLYARQNRSALLVATLRSLIDPDWYPPSEMIVPIAWAFLAEGDPASAIAWLDAQPDESSAEWLIVRAEAEKSSGAAGSKTNARSYLDSALKTLEGADDLDTIAIRLRVRHDLARLIHFIDHEPGRAVDIYETIEREWEGIPYSDLDRAITMRNLAEALMDTNRAAEGEKRADQSRALIPPWTQHIVVSELEYLRGRIAIRLDLGEEEIRCRFEECRRKALATSYMMLVAIVEARMFWRQPAQQSVEFFDHDGWLNRAGKLAVFERHAWAARVLIQGHLRAARRLGDAGYKGKARAELAEAQRLIDANPAFDRGRDRKRNATLHAGFSLYESDGATLWEEWRQRYTWSSEFPDDPQKVWELAG